MILEQIENFWEWFVQNETALKEAVGGYHPNTDQLVHEFNQHILGMGKLKWEVGNPNDGHFTLILSPNNDRKLLQLTYQIVSMAPALTNWTFYHELPATGESIIRLYDNNMEERSVNIKNWEASIIEYNDDRVTLAIFAPDTEYLDEDTQWLAVDLALNAILGEAFKIMHISELEIFTEKGEDEEVYFFSFESLKTRLS